MLSNTPVSGVPLCKWRPLPLALLNLAAALLLASWLWPATKAMWDQLDSFSFHLLNGSLEMHPLWSGLWAITSLRFFDLVAAGLMLLLMLRKDWLFASTERFRALFTFMALLITLLVIRVMFARWVDAAGWQHSSPSLVVADSLRLSQQYPWLTEHLKLKDSSNRSFPGDHASVLMLWGIFMALVARGKKLLLILCVTVFLMLPRLVAGAHWMSDVLVGGSFLTLLAMAWGYCTPLAGVLATGMLKVATPIIRRLPAWI